jgi:tRNA A37 N6-isopentenylltransferase MiaA
MKKAIIILGPDRSGKTKKAKELASQYAENEILWYDGKSLTTKKRNLIRQKGGDTTKDTKIIVFDDLKKKK